MVRMWRGRVKPINRTNGGLTALGEEDPSVAAAGWTERRGRGLRQERHQLWATVAHQAAVTV